MASIDWLSVIIFTTIGAIGMMVLESSPEISYGAAGWVVFVGGSALFWIGVEKRAHSTV